MNPLELFTSRALQPRILVSEPNKTPLQAAIRAQLAIVAIADQLVADVAKPAAELSDGSITLQGAAKMRRDLAQRALARLDAEVLPQVRQAEQTAKDGAAALQQTAAAAIAKLSPFDIARATATFAAASSGDELAREQFVAGVADGVEACVLAGLVAPAVGPWAAIAEQARARFADAQLPAERRGEVRRVEIASRIVRMQLDDARRSVATLAESGEQAAPMSARDLLARASDATYAGLLADGEKLGVLVPRAASTGAPSTIDNSHGEAWRARVEANLARKSDVQPHVGRAPKAAG